MAKARTLTLKTQVEVTGADKLSNLGQKFQKTGTILTAAVTGPLALLGNAAADAASELNESVNAIDVVFGNAADKIHAYGETAAEAAGLSRRAFNELVTPVGAMLQNVGFSADEAAEASINLAQRAADMASVFNTDVSEALGAIQAGLRGEADPLERFGVGLSDAAVTAKALQLGLADTAGELTANEKAQARLALLMEQTDAIAGDFANTSGEVANQQRIAAAEAENAAAALGQKFLPIKQKVVELLGKALDAWSSLPGPMQDGVVVIAGAAAALGPLLLGLGTLLRLAKQLKPALGGLRTSLGAGPLGIAGLAIAAGAALHELGKEINSATSSLNDDFIQALEDAGMNVGIAGSAVQQLADDMGLSLDEVQSRILGFVNGYGLSLEEAARRTREGYVAMTDAQEEALAESGSAWERYQAQIRGAADDLAEQLPDAFEEAEEKAKEIVRRTPGSLAAELRDGLDDYQKALDEIVEMTEKSVSDLRERAEIEAVLASEGITNGLNSDSMRTRLETLELVNDLISDYELLAPGAYGAGQLVNPELKRAIDSNIQLAEQAGQRVVDAAGNPLVNLPSEFYTSAEQAIKAMVLGIDDNMWRLQAKAYELADQWRNVFPSSEPKDPRSPFRGITKAWGFMDTLAHGLASTSGTVGRTLAGSLAAPSFAMAGATAMPVGGAAGGVTINLTVNGDLTSDREAGIVNSVMRAWNTAGGTRG